MKDVMAERTRRLLVTVPIATLGAVAALAGCTSTDGDLTDSVSESPPNEAMATYQLPLDDYMISPFEWNLGNYAENLLVEQCMNDHGFQWEVPRRDVDSLAPSVVQSPSGRKIFTAQIASTYGYHAPEWLPQDVVAAERALGSQVLTADKQATLDACILDDARDALPLPENYLQLATGLANEALVTALESNAVVSAAQQWQECMAPLGIPDLPNTPYEMPPDSLASGWGSGEPETEASVDEIRIASADAACRTSSGFDIALYDAEWSLQAEALAENADELVAERTAAQDYVKRVHETLAEIGG